jgi:uncharacterized membrane protein
MLIMIAGIVLFLGVHTLTTLRPTRAKLIAHFGLPAFKAAYSVLAIAGFVLIVWGFSRYRAEGWIQLWTPPAGMRHLTLPLMWFAFVALAAMGKAPGRIRGLAHLLVNGDAGGMILFGSFLAWAVYDRIAVKRRGDTGAPKIASFTRADAMALGVGTIAYVAMIFLHPLLIGVAVIGR